VLDVTLLRIMKYREEFNKVVGHVPRAAIDPKTLAIMDDMQVYWDRFPEHTVIDFQLFTPMFHRRHPGLPDDKRTVYNSILRNIDADADHATTDGVMQDLHDLALGTKIANIAQQYHSGDLANPLIDELSAAIDRYKAHVGIKQAGWIDTSIGDLLDKELNNVGLHWRLSCLNENMRGLRPGDFLVVAGRPDRGKTTFLASELTWMARQLPEDRNVIWLNNEGKGERIVPRLYQAALGVHMSTMGEMHKRGELVPAYREQVGRLDRIRVHDVHGANTRQIETILDTAAPGIVVFDMLDHITGSIGSGARADTVLEEVYKWARERAVKYDCVVIATSQISNDGDGMQFPLLGHLKDSKTGKQGTADALIMIGASNDPSLCNSRYISLPKNKLRPEGATGDPRAEVHYQPQIARYTDILEGA
jgi:replicative DNA helicase